MEQFNKNYVDYTYAQCNSYLINPSYVTIVDSNVVAKVALFDKILKRKTTKKHFLSNCSKTIAQGPFVWKH